LIDLAIGVLVFELGTRIRPRWLIDNPWLALTCLLESAFTGLLVAGGLVVLGAQPLAALVAGAIAMSTSPVITMVVMHESRPRGQVSERLLLMCAVNSVIAMLAIKAWRVWAAVDGPPGSELMAAATGATTVICGSFLLGVATGYALDRLSRPVRGESALAVLQIALVIVAALLATQWKLSPLLVLLVAGVVSRDRMGHRLTVEPHLGTAGAALSVLLFISFGVLFTLENASMLWPWVAAIIVTRFAGKALAIMALAKPSGLSGRQAIALTLALQPMGSLTVLLAADTFDWSVHLPGVGSPALQALLIATTLMQLTGPVWSQLALHLVARETYDR
jgi:Kef-type K+ transport system membrane component KefB